MIGLALTILLTLATAHAAQPHPNADAILKRAIKAADKDRDGQLDLEEFKLLDVQARNHGDEHFERGDTNGDGLLDPQELVTEYRKISRMGGHAEHHHRSADTDEDGFLDLKEFTAHANAKLESAADKKL